MLNFQIWEFQHLAGQILNFQILKFQNIWQAKCWISKSWIFNTWQANLEFSIFGRPKSWILIFCKPNQEFLNLEFLKFWCKAIQILNFKCWITCIRPNLEFSIFGRPNLAFPNLKFSIFGFPKLQFSMFARPKSWIFDILQVKSGILKSWIFKVLMLGHPNLEFQMLNYYAKSWIFNIWQAKSIWHSKSQIWWVSLFKEKCLPHLLAKSCIYHLPPVWENSRFKSAVPLS